LVNEATSDLKDGRIQTVIGVACKKYGQWFHNFPWEKGEEKKSTKLQANGHKDTSRGKA